MRLLTAADVAEKLNVSLSTISKLVASGRLRGYRIGRCLRVSDDALLEFLEGVVTECPQKSDAAAPVVCEAETVTEHGVDANTAGKSSSRSEAGGSVSQRRQRLAEKLLSSSATAAPTTSARRLRALPGGR